MFVLLGLICVASEAAPAACALDALWSRWAARLHPGQRARFDGAGALLLCDLGYITQGTARWRRALQVHPDDIVTKWRWLRATGSKMIAQYPTLDAEVAA